MTHSLCSIISFYQESVLINTYEYVFQACYSREFNTLYVLVVSDEISMDRGVAVIVSPNSSNRMRVSFDVQEVNLSDVDLSSCVPVHLLQPTDRSLEWRFFDYLALAVSRRLERQFTSSFCVRAKPHYRDLKKAMLRLLGNRDDYPDQVHYLFSDDLDLVGTKMGSKNLFRRIFSRHRPIGIGPAVESSSRR